MLSNPSSPLSLHPDATSLLNDALDALSDHLALLGPSGEILAVNRAWAEFGMANGYAGSGFGVGQNYVDVCELSATDGSELTVAAAMGIRRVLDGELESFVHDYPCHAPTAERWFRMHVRRMARPSPVAAIVTHTDRTSEFLAARSEAAARDKAESERRAADIDRRRLEATLEAIPVGVWIAGADGGVTHANPAAAQIWGGRAPLPDHQDEYAHYTAWLASTGVPLRPEDWPISHTLATGQSVNGVLLEIARFDETRGYVLTSSAPIRDGEGSLTGAIAINVDITTHQEAARDRERLLATLQRERTQLAAVFDQAPAFLAVLRGPQHVFQLVNHACQYLMGHRDVIGHTVADALPELASQGFIDILDQVRATGDSWTGRRVPVQLARSPGASLETRYVDLVYQRLTEPDGEYSIVSHGIDVTDQVVASEGLTQSERRLREQFAKLPVPTYLWELRVDDFFLVDCNDAARETLPQYGAQVIGLPSRAIFPGAEEISVDMLRSLRDNVVVRRGIEYDVGPPLGMRRFDLTIGPQQPDRVLLHAVDTTDRGELEAQLRQAQKMDAVGRLAGGVAHDFNNLLTVISAHSAFLMESLDSSNPLREDVEAIHKAGIRAAGLTRQLLAFSRKQILKPFVMDLNATVAEARKMLERLLGENIEIMTMLADDVERVVADPSQIDQVLVNLAVNARDAMPQGGQLTIETRRVTMPAGEDGSRRMIAPGVYSVLSVRDAGVGMDGAVQGRLFEPFFTTKEPGKGTGLGLATVYGIVKQSNGYITVESAPGQGSAFHVYLPAVVDPMAREQLHDAVRAVARGVETILLVEDEPAVREVARRVLVREGYVVLEAENGHAALSVSNTFDSVIHLVVSDVVMPGMQGGEVVRRLQQSRPGLKALFMSGYTDDDIVRRGIGSAAVPFVQKPFMAKDLTRAVRDALEG
jgi:signal transduction histidine kinase/CheY-like chemotaxis protein